MGSPVLGDEVMCEARAVSWSRACGHAGCKKKPAYALINSTDGKRWCGAHAPPGSRDVVSRRCQHPGCFKKPNYGFDEKKGLWCKPHAPPEARDVVSRKCEHVGCTKQPHYGLEVKKARWCTHHAPEGSFDVMSKRCEVKGCRSKPYWGFEARKPRFCRAHAPEDSLRVAGQRCEHRTASGVRCAKFPKLADPAEPWRARWCSDHPPSAEVVLADISKLPTCPPAKEALAPATPTDSEAGHQGGRVGAGPWQAAEALELLGVPDEAGLRRPGRPPLRRQLETRASEQKQQQKRQRLSHQEVEEAPSELRPPSTSSGGETTATLPSDVILPSMAVTPPIPASAGPGMLECLLAGYILDSMARDGGVAHG